MKKFALVGMVAALVLGLQVLSPAQQPATEASAGQMKPLVTVAISGYDQIISDIRSVSAQGAMLIEGMINSVTDSKGLQGLDKKRPWGVLVRTDGEQFPAQAFLPVSDLAKLMKSLEPSIGEIEAKDGVYEINVQDRTIYLKQAGDWAFASLSADGLKDLPKDPLAALGDLPKEYDLGIRVAVKNVPTQFRQLAIGMLQMVGQQGLQQKEGESDEQHELRAKAFEQSTKQLSQMLNELDTLVLGLKIDSKAGNALLDFAITALQGTDLAKQYGAVSQPVETRFGGFLQEGAVLTLAAAQKIPEATASQIESSLTTARAGALADLENQGLSGDDLALAKDLTGQLFDVFEKTIKGGKFDVGASVKLGPEVLTVVAGAQLAETEKVDQILKKLAERVSKEEPQTAQAIKLNAEQYEGIQFHRISVPTDVIKKTGELDLKKLVGDTINVIVGVGKESVYLSAGRDAMEALKKAIDASKQAKKVPPMQVKIAATPLLKFVGSITEKPEVQNVVAMLSGVLEGAPGKDHIVITSTAIPNGAKTRIELEQGIVKILGMLPMLAATM